MVMSTKAVKIKKIEDKSSVNVATLKAKLSEYLGLAKGGAEVIVTDHKLPVARLVPFLTAPGDGLIAQEPSLPISFLVKMSEAVGKKISGFDSLDALLDDRNKR